MEPGAIIGSLLLLAVAVTFWIIDPYHRAVREWNRLENKRRAQTESPTSRINHNRNKLRNTHRDKPAFVLTALGLAAAFGSWAYFVISPAPRAYVGLALITVCLCCCAIAYWEFVDWSWKFKVPTLVVGILLCAGASFRWASYETRPSFVFMVPGVVLNGNSWDFIINHRGPKSNESVQIMFIDVDRQTAVLSGHPKVLTQQDLNSYQRFLNYPEINPKGHGQIFALQFLWTPLVFDHEHYTMEITDRDHNVHEDLQIENVGGKWFWAAQIQDSDQGKQLLNCKDAGFPYGDKAPIPCFPKVMQYGD